MLIQGFNKVTLMVWWTGCELCSLIDSEFNTFGITTIIDIGLNQVHTEYFACQITALESINMQINSEKVRRHQPVVS